MDAMVLWRSQERTVANRPALKGEFGQTSLSPCYACLRQADTSSSAWKGSAPSASTLGLKSYIYYGIKTNKKNLSNPTPSLLYYLFFQCCPNLTCYRKSWHIPQRHCEGGTPQPMDTQSTSLSHTHPDCLFSPSRRIPSLLLSKGRSLTSWVFQVWQ